MTYTLSLDFWMDDDEIIPDEELIEIIEQMLNGTAWGASNIRVLDVND